MSLFGEASPLARGGEEVRSSASGSRRRRPTRDAGTLAILLHTHMPYVEGFGTWPFGEEWLWEAMATCYLPLLDLLDSGAPLTLSLTPVLADQLEVPDLAARFRDFVLDVRSLTHHEDARGLRESGRGELACELERALEDYQTALERLDAHGCGLLHALGAHAHWTSSATHAILPLLASDALVGLQVQAGIKAHLLRFGGDWRGGFWLPECAHSPHLEPLLARAGVAASCVELSWLFRPGAREHLRPLLSDSGVVLVPIDRATIDLVWSGEGYPARGLYRDYHRRTVHNHSPWSNAGGAYDHEGASALARQHAADFVGRVRARLQRDGHGLPGGGLIVFAIDTELLGHWWYEGLTWLRAVVDESARQGLAIVPLDEALATHEPVQPEHRMKRWEASSWGRDGDLSTWSALGSAAEMAFQARACELALLRARRAAGGAAVRELLALQSSDWAFMAARGLAVPYAQARFEGHLKAFQSALAEGPRASSGGLRNLAVHADPGLLLEQ
jgi:1,4-alpha-glucan branching enzyme